MFNSYISGLLSLRREIDNRIDNEIEDCTRERGDSEGLVHSLEYILKNNVTLSGRYKNDEKTFNKE